MKLLGLIDTEDDESTEPGNPYLFCYPDKYSNVSIRPVVCLNLLGSYFNACN